MTSVIFALGLAYYSPAVREPGVFQSRTTEIEFPLAMSDTWRQKSEAFRLWVSEDQGRTWRLHQQVAANGTRFPYAAPTDGHYWFAPQTVLKDGKLEPPKVDSTSVSQKVYVNIIRRPVIHRHTFARPAATA